MVGIHLTLAGTAPIFQQIVDQVVLAVRRGDLAPGAAMPSVRALAETLVINPNTVARAYSELVRVGVLEAQRGRGVFVAQRRELYADSEQQRRLAAAVDRLVGDAAMLGLTADQVRAAVEQGLARLDPDASGNSTTKGRGHV
jgi:GntR family transcriptional regulator